MVCPSCGKEVKELKGVCEHCQADLSEAGFRQMLTDINDNTKTVREDIDSLKKANDELAGKVKYLEDKRNTMSDVVKSEKKVSLSRLFNGLMTNKWEGAEFERDVMEEGAQLKRDMGTGSVAAGGAVVPQQYLPGELIEQLRAKLVCQQMGARVLDGLVGSPVLLPKVATGATVHWVGENGQKTPNDLVMDQLSLSPHEAACLVKVSNRLIQLSNPSIDALIAGDMGKAIALAIDQEALIGIGNANGPVGILNTPNIGTYDLAADAGSGATPTATDIANIVYTLKAANGDAGTIGWVSNPRFFSQLSRMRAGAEANDITAGPFLYNEELRQGMLEGYKIGSTTQVPVNVVKGNTTDDSYIFFGNWSDLIIAYWGAVEFRISTEAGDAFQYNQTWLRASVLCDVGVRNVGSFVVVDGVRA